VIAVPDLVFCSRTLTALSNQGLSGECLLLLEEMRWEWDRDRDQVDVSTLTLSVWLFLGVLQFIVGQTETSSLMMTAITISPLLLSISLPFPPVHYFLIHIHTTHTHPRERGLTPTPACYAVALNALEKEAEWQKAVNLLLQVCEGRDEEREK
jgi:hypothetical protein